MPEACRHKARKLGIRRLKTPPPHPKLIFKITTVEGVEGLPVYNVSRVPVRAHTHDTL